MQPANSLSPTIADIEIPYFHSLASEQPNQLFGMRNIVYFLAGESVRVGVRLVSVSDGVAWHFSVLISGKGENFC